MKPQKKTNWLDRTAQPKLPYMALCLTVEELRQALDHIKVPFTADMAPPAHGARALTFERAGSAPTCLIVLSPEFMSHSPVEQAGLLVHEGVHVWQQYRKYLNMHEVSAEQEAYGIQYISETLMEEFARRIAR